MGNSLEYEFSEQLNWIQKGNSILVCQIFPKIIPISGGHKTGKRTIAIVVMDNGYVRNDSLCLLILTTTICFGLAGEYY